MSLQTEKVNIMQTSLMANAYTSKIQKSGTVMCEDKWIKLKDTFKTAIKI